jgi:tripartite-type tricarboxylate transporter receptor subunit TctC
MTLARAFIALAALALSALGPAPAAAQDWPTRPVKAITTTSAGGLSDIFMRALGEELRQNGASR